MNLHPLDRLRGVRAWQGQIPLESRYTVGLAAQPFFDALRREGKLLASRCPACNTKSLPPTLACPHCFETMEAYEEVKPAGRVEAITTVHRDLFDQPLLEPQRVALVSFAGVEGGLIHFVLDEGLHIGDPVEVVLRPAQERSGGIGDVAGFRRAV